MTDREKAKQFLGLKIQRHDSSAICLRQSKYIRTILECFGMDDANSVTTPLHDKVRLKAKPEGETEVDAR